MYFFISKKANRFWDPDPKADPDPKQQKILDFKGKDVQYFAE
jgi:hypothetical protein